MRARPNGRRRGPDPVPRHQLVVLTRAKPGRRAEFEHWYDRQHIPDCLRVPGIVGARRWSIGDGLRSAAAGLPVEPAGWDALAIYELETDDPVALARDLIGRAGSADMPSSDALDRTSIVKFVARLAEDR